MKRSILLFLLFFLLLAAGCSAKPATSNSAQPGKVVDVGGAGSYRDLTPAELQSMLKNKDFTLINVHIPFDGNLPSTDLSIPYDQITTQLDKIPNKDAKLVLYCRSGRMSTIAAKELVKAGYTNIYQLAGGMADWERAGGKVER